MSIGRIFSTAPSNDAGSRKSGRAKSAFEATVGTSGEGTSVVRTGMNLRPGVQRQFMRMMDAHDRMRAQVLESSSTGGYRVSGD